VGALQRLAAKPVQQLNSPRHLLQSIIELREK
jgi:hypothetical protein